MKEDCETARAEKLKDRGIAREKSKGKWGSGAPSCPGISYSSPKAKWSCFRTIRGQWVDPLGSNGVLGKSGEAWEQNTLNVSLRGMEFILQSLGAIRKRVICTLGLKYLGSNDCRGKRLEVAEQIWQICNSSGMSWPRPHTHWKQCEEKGRIYVQALSSKIFLWPLVSDCPPLAIISQTIDIYICFFKIWWVLKNLFTSKRR